SRDRRERGRTLSTAGRQRRRGRGFAMPAQHPAGGLACKHETRGDHMKRVWNSLIAGAILGMGLLVATGAVAQEKKTLVFVVNGASDFWKIAEAGVKKAQGELPKYSLQFKYPEQAAAAVQQRVMEDLVAAG